MVFQVWGTAFSVMRISHTGKNAKFYPVLLFLYGFFICLSCVHRVKRKVLHGVTSPLNHFPYLNFFVSPYRSPYLAVLASGNWRHKKFSNLKNQNSVTLDFHLLRTAFAVEGQSCKRSQNTCFLGKTVLYV